MNAGKYRHRITLLKPSKTTQNEANEEVPSYIPWRKVPAAVIPLRGREYQEAQKIRAETPYRVEMRYFAGVTPDMQVKLYDERILEIQNVLNIDERNRELHLMCVEKVM